MTDRPGGDDALEHSPDDVLEQVDDESAAEIVPDPPQTGDEGVDEALARLAGVAGEPLETQVPVFDAVHRTLQDRLADVEG